MKAYITTIMLALMCTLTTLGQKARVKSVTGQRLEITQAQDDRIKQEVEDILAPYKPGIDSLTAPIIGQSTQFMRVSDGESLLGNLLCDILVDVSRQYGKRADLAIANKGGIRSALPEGPITIGHIMEIAPFENVYTMVTMRGDILIHLMEQIAAMKGQCVSRDVQLTVAGSKLQSLTIRGRKVNPKRYYRVATIDYVAEGNDGMTAFRDVEPRQIIRSNVLVRDVYINYIRNLTRQGKKVSSKLDGRIRFESTNDIQTTAAPEKKVVNLTIVHTNDSHSCIMPYNPNSSDTQSANKGGFLRRTVVVDSLRQIDPELLLLDDGDFSQGSAYYNLYRGDVETDFMNYMRYDACTIGNHEFDFGLENMARLFRRMKFPVVCCNYDFSGTVVEGTVLPYTIIERRGLRIGVTGVGAPLRGLVSATKCEGVRYLDPAAEAERIGRHLKQDERCDLVICLSHLGVSPSDSINDQYLTSHTTSIDAVISGHSHTYFTEIRRMNNAAGIPVPVQQEGKNARFVGVINLEVEK